MYNAEGLKGRLFRDEVYRILLNPSELTNKGNLKYVHVIKYDKCGLLVCNLALNTNCNSNNYFIIDEEIFIPYRSIIDFKVYDDRFCNIELPHTEVPYVENILREKVFQQGKLKEVGGMFVLNHSFFEKFSNCEKFLVNFASDCRERKLTGIYDCFRGLKISGLITDANEYGIYYSCSDSYYIYKTFISWKAILMINNFSYYKHAQIGSELMGDHSVQEIFSVKKAFYTQMLLGYEYYNGSKILEWINTGTSNGRSAFLDLYAKPDFNWSIPIIITGKW